MRTYTLFAALAVLAACGSNPPPPEKHDPRTDELVKKHSDIWQLMGLSQNAQDELNRIVIAVNEQMMKNKQAHPEMFKEEPKRMGKEPTHEEYMAKHKERFDRLHISDSTQRELLKAAEVVWDDLHNPNVSAEEKKRAETIKNMMSVLKGPPPCCDDNIFKKAGSQ